MLFLELDFLSDNTMLCHELLGLLKQAVFLKKKCLCGSVSSKLAATPENIFPELVRVSWYRYSVLLACFYKRTKTEQPP